VLGEMHIRRGRYIGVAPIPGGLTNVCLVRPSRPGDADLRDPAALLSRELMRDPLLRDRAADARLAAPPVVLGPLAVDATGARLDGLLLAGDAAGFIDPMTGDGLRFAVRGGELAAAAAMRRSSTAGPASTSSMQPRDGRNSATSGASIARSAQLVASHARRRCRGLRRTRRPRRAPQGHRARRRLRHDSLSPGSGPCP
jgi:hypothetical protein